MSTPEQTEEPADDLAKPLGRKAKKKKRFVIPAALVVRTIAGLLGLCVAVLAGWILFVDDPAGGEPLAIVSADTRGSPQPAKPGSSSNTRPDAVAPPTALADTDTAPSPNTPAGGNPAAKTVTIIDGSTGKRQEVTVGGPGAASCAKQPNSGKPDAVLGEAGIQDRVGDGVGDLVRMTLADGLRREDVSIVHNAPKEKARRPWVAGCSAT